MSKVLAVAWRDFKYTALTKTFILAAVLFPALMFGVAVVLQILMHPTPPPLVGAVVIVDSTGLTEPMVRLELDNTHFRRQFDESAPAKDALPQGSHSFKEFQGARFSRRGRPGETAPPRLQLTINYERDHTDAVINRLKESVRGGESLVLAVIDPSLLDAPPNGSTFDLFVAPGINPDHSDILGRAIGRAIVRARVHATGSDLATAQALVSQPWANTIRIRADGGEAVDNPIVKILIPVAFMMLLWLSSFTSSNYLLTSTIEEKSNKVMEVLLSAVSPMQLMTGKILGQGLVGLIMLLTYSGMGIAGLVVLSYADYIPPMSLVYLAVYFFMAFFMVASIMAGVGSAVSDLREAQSLVAPATMILVVPLLLWFPISQNPNGTLAFITSFIPPMTPFAMILRVTGSEPVPTWQIIATIIYGYAMTVAMIGMSAKIFRVGVLMYGKPPTPWQLLKWIRYS